MQEQDAGGQAKGLVLLPSPFAFGSRTTTSVDCTGRISGSLDYGERIYYSREILSTRLSFILLLPTAFAHEEPQRVYYLQVVGCQTQVRGRGGHLVNTCKTTSAAATLARCFFNLEQLRSNSRNDRCLKLSDCSIATSRELRHRQKHRSNHIDHGKNSALEECAPFEAFVCVQIARFSKLRLC